MEFSIQKYN